MVSEWHNADFEEIWAKKRANANRRKSVSAGFIVDDEKAIKRKKNNSSMWLLVPTTDRALTLPQPEFCTRSRFEPCFECIASTPY